MHTTLELVLFSFTVAYALVELGTRWLSTLPPAPVPRWGRRPYLAVPGYIRSAVDGDIHYISGEYLVHLYRIDPDKCVITTPRTARYHSLLAEAYAGKRIILGPKADGDYPNKKRGKIT